MAIFLVEGQGGGLWWGILGSRRRSFYSWGHLEIETSLKKISSRFLSFPLCLKKKKSVYEKFETNLQRSIRTILKHPGKKRQISCQQGGPTVYEGRFRQGEGSVCVPHISFRSCYGLNICVTLIVTSGNLKSKTNEEQP